MARQKRYRDDAPSDNEDALGKVAALSSKLDRAKSIAEECGLGEGFVNAIKKRLERKHIATTEALRATNNKELLAVLDDRLFRMLQYMDDFVMADASLRDLSFSAEMLMRQRQLLLGQPTQILSVQERRNINDLLGACFKEAKRRGMTIEVPFTVEEGATCVPASNELTTLPELA
ncbi:hypothetical protein LCGC14_2851380 [marine sediment metagenome]|uniref:Uncharacterized protein n=1 Tax=marine sediment metagenome TaxID=412755 RepID=A0A0F9AGK6_9ZZZZ